jgi:DHA2 family multidrug resistance protein-like MFS transporter
VGLRVPARAPLTALLLLAGPFLLPESRDPAPGPFDLPSAALSLGTMLPFVYGIKLMAEHGITFQAGLAVVAGVSLGVVFLRRQRRLTHPMIDLSLFSYRGFRAGIGANFVACIAWASALFFLTQYLQLVLGMSAVRAGMHLLPGLALSLAGTMLARRLLARWRVATLIRLALGIAGVGFGLLAFVARDGGALTASVAYVLIGSGLNITIALGVDAVMEHVPPRQAGAGSAVSETANELGIALGTAVLGSIVTAVYRRRLDHVAGVPDAVIDEGRETLGGAVHAAAGLPEPARTALLDSARQAFVDGTRIATLVCAVLVVAAGWGVRRALRP